MDRAVALLRGLRDELPQVEDRKKFWREHVRKEPAILALARTPGMAQLAKEYGQ